MSRPRVVLCSTDFSAPAEEAFACACALAGPGGKVVLLHVAPQPITLDEVAESRKPDYRADLRAKLQAIVPADPQVNVTRLIDEGDVTEAILRVAQGQGCEAIVQGTHGRSGLSRMFLGSTALEVIRQARCPVLTVRAPASPAPEAASGP
jgi:universal stress protein A